jgi:hypothetical protein
MKLPLTRLGRLWLFGLIALAGVLTLLSLPPLRQSQAYHMLADRRPLLGIPNFLDVVSNAGFLFVGLMGTGFLLKRRANQANGGFQEPVERLPYAVFFLGVALTGLGSACYHWTPNDSSLTWDRLPMTLAFMSILAAVIAERIDLRVGLWLLGPFVLAGAGSVWYWRGNGNLWPYAAAQYFSIFLVGALLCLFPARYSRGADLLWAAGLYGLAKVAEALDARIFAVTHFVSGHTLKHLLAAFAVYWVLRMLVIRTPVRNADLRW